MLCKSSSLLARGIGPQRTRIRARRLPSNMPNCLQPQFLSSYLGSDLISPSKFITCQRIYLILPTQINSSTKDLTLTTRNRPRKRLLNISGALECALVPLRKMFKLTSVFQRRSVDAMFSIAFAPRRRDVAYARYRHLIGRCTSLSCDCHQDCGLADVSCPLYFVAPLDIVEQPPYTRDQEEQFIV
ncbi:hypothetical protein K474DRAFT_934859 [Panus rudis PR-1116 ss-1]|nr:hypothetical protein K474DRAFT_934859 [Panus rudis PR-1116 ss-1]